jgi:poly(A) polymerase
VLLKNGLTVDFAPLRAPSIIEDLQLRDFTVNSFALPLNKSFPEAALLDPLDGLNHLRKRQLQLCSGRSFSDDPLRMLKGIRHAVTLGFTLSADTLQQLSFSAHLLSAIAGERIRDELSKILAAENALMGIELLIDTGLFKTLFGPVSIDWDRQVIVDELTNLAAKIHEIEQATKIKLPESGSSELFSNRVLFLLAKVLKYYPPDDLPDLLHNKLRLSRYQQRLIESLQSEPDTELFSLAFSIEGQRLQALIVEQLEPFSFEKLLYWGVCHNLLTLNRALDLQASFTAEQKLGRIPDLLNGRQIAALLQGHQNYQIGEWQIKLKLAEINGEINTFQQAGKWLKNEL